MYIFSKSGITKKEIYIKKWRWIKLKNQKNETNIIASYKEDCSISKEDFIKKYKVSEKGLSNKEANSRIQNLGLNESLKNGIIIS